MVDQVSDRAIRTTKDWKLANNPPTMLRSSRTSLQIVDSDGLNLTVISGQRRATPQNDIVTTGNPGISQPRWQPPTHGRVKCNIDASLSDKFNRKGIDFCSRDEDDIFVLAKIFI